MARKRSDERWMPVDHACRECGGRVVMVTNAGPTGGGNPVYKCADCERGSSGMGPEFICWCGFRHRSQADPAYRCVRFDTGAKDPVLAGALQRAGYLSSADPWARPKAAIVVVSEDTIRWAQREQGGLS